ncbi:MAG: hypothetical protein ACFNVK_01620 [Prevotella sp.]
MELFPKQWVAAGQWQDITNKCRECIDIIAEMKGEKASPTNQLI